MSFVTRCTYVLKLGMDSDIMSSSPQYADRELMMIRPVEQRQRKRVFCYNCGQKGHFGFVSYSMLCDF